MQNKIKTAAIVLSSHVIGLSVIRALGLSGVPVVAVYYEENDMGYVSKYVQEKIRAPHPEKQESQFISLLKDCATRFGGSLLVPADDATLSAVSRHKSRLENYYIVACPEWKITEQFIDKKYTYALAEAIGIPVPKTITPVSLEELEDYAQSIAYPCIVKPCQSHLYFQQFKTKMVRVENSDQMLQAYKQATEAGIEVMIQELIPGDDTQGANYNSYFYNGEPLVEFTAQKVRLSPPAFGVPRVVISKHIPEIIEPGRKIIQALGYHGYACTEFKKDARDGVYKLMEVNGRHNRSGLLSVRCGINFPWIEYQHLVQGKQPSACSYSTGIYWIDEFNDIFRGAKYRHQERYSLMQYIRPYIKNHIFAVLDGKDLRPFLKRAVDIMRMVLRRISFYMPFSIRSPKKDL
jgi:predicted ATP-grasp superfamily ATP-dependent carboligase